MQFFVLVVICAVAWLFWRRWKRKQLREERHRRIDSYPYPDAIQKKLKEHYPHLSDTQIHTVMMGLREYFHLCHSAGKQMVAMPSQVVDVAWHEFILFTRDYEQFCKQAFGRFLHHTPAEAMTTPTLAQDGIKRAWQISCWRGCIKPDAPHRLPILFAMDAELNIEDGFFYSLHCQYADFATQHGMPVYCASDIGCGSGMGSGASCGGDGGGCGGGGD